MTHRGTTNTNDRGSASDRRSRKMWLLAKFGSGTVCFCAHLDCKTVLTYETLTVERVKPGCEGGRYTRDNILPMCARHNSSLGGAMSSPRARARRLQAVD